MKPKLANGAAADVCSTDVIVVVFGTVVAVIDVGVDYRDSRVLNRYHLPKNHYLHCFRGINS